MTITQINLVSVPVSDQGRAKAFYAGTLGFEVVSDSPVDETGPAGARFVVVAPKGAETGIALVTWFPSLPPGSVKGLVLATTDADGDATRLRAAGVAVSGPTDASWGRFIAFDDPDGNGIVLAGPRWS